MTVAVVVLAVVVAGLVPTAIVPNFKLASTLLKLGRETAKYLREKKRANDAIKELNAFRASTKETVERLRGQVRRYRDEYLEATPDTPEGRQTLGDELDREFDRLVELLSPKAGDREADPGGEAGLPGGSGEADDRDSPTDAGVRPG